MNALNYNNRQCLLHGWAAMMMGSAGLLRVTGILPSSVLVMMIPGVKHKANESCLLSKTHISPLWIVLF